MKLARDQVLEAIKTLHLEHPTQSGFPTIQLAERLGMQRANLSRLLNELVRDQRLQKSEGRPVLYSLKPAGEDSCFQRLVGCNGSLKQSILLIKAALLYPSSSLPILITGEDGTGKSMIASLIDEFVRQKQIVEADAPFVKINCFYLEENSPSRNEQLLFGADGFLEQSEGGILFIDHINRLDRTVQNQLISYAQNEGDSRKPKVLVFSIDSQIASSLKTIYTSKLSVIAELPPLASRNFEERFDLIQRFFQKEAQSLRKQIKINAEVLRCLMLYPISNNVRQLKNDIRLACASRYTSNLDSVQDTMELQIHDFPAYVRKGFLSYPRFRDQIEQIIPDHYLYTFSPGKTNARKESPRGQPESFYGRIDRLADELKHHQLDESDISAIIRSAITSSFEAVDKQLDSEEINKDLLAKMVNPCIISLTEEFLQQASGKMRRVYPSSLFYVLSLHLQEMLDTPRRITSLTSEQVVHTIHAYGEEYALVQKFVQKLEQQFPVKISVDEAVFLTLLITEDAQTIQPRTHPVVLVAMHGRLTASSIVEVCSRISEENTIFAFDLDLDADMQQLYEDLRDRIIDIHQGKGILMLYDMGSLKQMASMIAQETGIQIKAVCIPSTLIALDCARKAGTGSSLDTLYQEAVSSYSQIYPEIHSSLLKEENQNVILCLCMSGQGSAVQMKHYIEQHALLEHTDVLALATSERAVLLKKVNELQSRQRILCVIGTYDPKLLNIPFISLSRVLEATDDRLDFLLHLEETIPAMTVHYDSIYAYLGEQMPELNLKALKKTLPRLISRIKVLTNGLSSDQEIGLFMHIACAIDRLKHGEKIIHNEQRDTLISRNKKLYHSLRELLVPLEKEFEVQFDDDELAYLLQTIRQC